MLCIYCCKFCTVNFGAVLSTVLSDKNQLIRFEVRLMTVLLDCQCWVAEETKNVCRKQRGNILQNFLFEYTDMTEILTL